MRNDPYWTSRENSVDITDKVIQVPWLPLVVTLYSRSIRNDPYLTSREHSSIITDKIIHAGTLVSSCSDTRPVRDDPYFTSRKNSLDISETVIANILLANGSSDLCFCDIRLEKGVYGVVYFSGHGYEESGETFLLPVDFDLEYSREHSLRVQEILDAMQQCDASLNLLIIDACGVR